MHRQGQGEDALRVRRQGVDRGDQRAAAGGQFVLGIQTMPGLPYDGHTLKDQIAQVERLTGEKVARVYVDKGYRGHGLAAPEIHVTQSPGQRSPTVKRELRRRAAVEPVIGHAKSDGLLERNRLAGARGDGWLVQGVLASRLITKLPAKSMA